MKNGGYDVIALERWRERRLWRRHQRRAARRAWLDLIPQRLQAQRLAGRAGRMAGPRPCWRAGLRACRLRNSPACARSCTFAPGMLCRPPGDRPAQAPQRTGRAGRRGAVDTTRHCHRHSRDGAGRGNPHGRSAAPPGLSGGVRPFTRPPGRGGSAGAAWPGAGHPMLPAGLRDRAACHDHRLRPQLPVVVRWLPVVAALRRGTVSTEPALIQHARGVALTARSSASDMPTLGGLRRAPASRAHSGTRPAGRPAFGIDSGCA